MGRLASSDHPVQYLFYIVLGVTAALVGIMFTRVLYWIEDLCDRIWRGPEWARPAVGGLFLGLILLVLPEMYGVGYPILQGGLEGKNALGFLIVLLVGKMLAIAVATIVSRVVMNDTIYTLKLRRRGVDVSKKSNIEVLNNQTVESIMLPQPAAIEWDLKW